MLRRKRRRLRRATRRLSKGDAEAAEGVKAGDGDAGRRGSATLGFFTDALEALDVDALRALTLLELMHQMQLLQMRHMYLMQMAMETPELQAVLPPHVEAGQLRARPDAAMELQREQARGGGGMGAGMMGAGGGGGPPREGGRGVSSATACFRCGQRATSGGTARTGSARDRQRRAASNRAHRADCPSNPGGGAAAAGMKRHVRPTGPLRAGVSERPRPDRSRRAGPWACRVRRERPPARDCPRAAVTGAARRDTRRGVPRVEKARAAASEDTYTPPEPRGSARVQERRRAEAARGGGGGGPGGERRDSRERRESPPPERPRRSSRGSSFASRARGDRRGDERGRDDGGSTATAPGAAIEAGGAGGSGHATARTRPRRTIAEGRSRTRAGPFASARSRTPETPGGGDAARARARAPRERGANKRKSGEGDDCGAGARETREAGVIRRLLRANRNTDYYAPADGRSRSRSRSRRPPVRTSTLGSNPRGGLISARP